MTNGRQSQGGDDGGQEDGQGRERREEGLLDAREDSGRTTAPIPPALSAADVDLLCREAWQMESAGEINRRRRALNELASRIAALLPPEET